MDVFTAIQHRRSVRQYRPNPVPVDDIKRVLQAANWAPSSNNTQPWRFIVAQGKAKDAFAQLYGEIVERGMPPVSERTAAQLQRLAWARTLGGAPIVIVALTKRGVPKPGAAEPSANVAARNAAGPSVEEYRRFKGSLVSTAAAVENLMLAATAIGLGTCWMLGPLAEEAKVRQIFDIGPEWEIVACTPLGYPAQMPAAPDRHDPDLQQKVTWRGF